MGWRGSQMEWKMQLDEVFGSISWLAASAERCGALIFYGLLWGVAAAQGTRHREEGDGV